MEPQYFVIACFGCVFFRRHYDARYSSQQPQPKNFDLWRTLTSRDAMNGRRETRFSLGLATRKYKKISFCFIWKDDQLFFFLYLRLLFLFLLWLLFLLLLLFLTTSLLPLKFLELLGCKRCNSQHQNGTEQKVLQRNF